MEYKSLGDRMKGAYENKYRFYIPERSPVIIRLDGCHFHSFCRGLKKPFDDIFIKTMQLTMKDLCENIMGCKFGFVQSDEISLLLINYENTKTQPWFDNNLQKIASVSASICTLYFNRNFRALVEQFNEDYMEAWNTSNEDDKYFELLNKRLDTAYFDSRAFFLPPMEVCNYFIWRQQDATRNSILSLGQNLFSQKEIHGIKCNTLQDKMFNEKGINWNNLDTVKKRGTCAYRTVNDDDTLGKWQLDTEIPIFTQYRWYVEKWIPEFNYHNSVIKKLKDTFYDWTDASLDLEFEDISYDYRG